MTNFSGGAIMPFMTNSANYPFILLYDKDGFFVGCGEATNYSSQLSVGVNSSGNSNQNWLIMPYELALPFLRSLIGTQSHIPDRDAKIVSVINALISQLPTSKDSDILYPYDSPNGQQTILYKNDTFLVASGYDKRANPNGAQKVLSVGVRWVDKPYPIGPNSRKPQWFCLPQHLAVDFLKNLLNMQSNSVEFIDTNAINQAIAKL